MYKLHYEKKDMKEKKNKKKSKWMGKQSAKTTNLQSLVPFFRDSTRSNKACP